MTNDPMGAAPSGALSQRSDLKNLSFPPEYFQDEVREGFYISTMMKRFWAAQLKVLSHIAQICEKHDIKWYADCGSLLGAIRHQGFIPWDDDLDIGMLRSDWLRFFEVAEKELPAEYEVLTLKSREEFEQPLGRVVNSHAINYSPEHMKEYYGCPYAVGVDIFPLDGVYDDPEKEAYRKRRAMELVEKARALAGGDSRDLARRKKLQIKIEEIYSECPCENAEYVALMPFFVSKNNHKYSKALFGKIEKHPFETTYINVPSRYDEVLRIEYGNYTRIIKGGGIHVYPAYSVQQEILKKAWGHNPYAYTLVPKELLASVQRYANRLTNVGTAGSVRARERRKVVALLPCRVKWWSSMESLWKYYSSRPEEYEVHVLPVFYFDCDYEGNVGQKHDERNLFPSEVPVEACESFDFAGIHPDIIVTQVPFDSYSTSFTLHEFFYSTNLVKLTDELIYVPCFDVEDPKKQGDKAEVAISTLVEQPAVINADRVILPTEKLKEVYLNHLVELCGEDTLNYWMQKILVFSQDMYML